MKIFYLILVSLTFLAILLTYSRTAYIMMLIGIATYLILARKLLFAVGAIIVVVLGITLFANTKIEGLNPFRTASSIARIESIQNASILIKDHPLFGVGFNAYRYAQIRYHFREQVTPYPTHADSGTDNSFLFILATSGIVGLAAYLYFLYYLFVSTYTKKFFLRNAFLAAMISWGIGSFFINGLFYPGMMFWMFSFYAVTQE